MSGGDQVTKAEIPAELKGLFGNTGSIMTGLQNYFWGAPQDTSIFPGRDKWEPWANQEEALAASAASATGGTPRKRIGQTPSDAGYTQDPTNLMLGFNPDETAGMSGWQQWVETQVPGLMNQQSSEYIAQNLGMAGLHDWQKGLSVGAEDPWVQAAKQTFEDTMSEDIKNQMTLSGLGRSTATGDALSKGWASMLLPAMQQGADIQKWQREGTTGWIGNVMMPTEMEIASRQRAGKSEAIGQGWELGNLQRDIEQSQYDKQAQERNRLRMLGEQSLFGPFGAFVPSTIGSRTSGGGLFK